MGKKFQLRSKREKKFPPILCRVSPSEWAWGLPLACRSLLVVSSELMAVKVTPPPPLPPTHRAPPPPPPSRPPGVLRPHYQPRQNTHAAARWHVTTTSKPRPNHVQTAPAILTVCPDRASCRYVSPPELSSPAARGVETNWLVGTHLSLRTV